MKCGRSDVTTLSLNCKITKGLVPINPKFKNRTLLISPQRLSRESLERHFALVRTINSEKIIQTYLFSKTDLGEDDDNDDDNIIVFTMIKFTIFYRILF